jgi:hypothetical protein
MTSLETWLNQATRHLSIDSAAQVRSEIQEHYQSALEAASSSGASAKDADQTAIAALGDAKLANRQYRRVLLTSAEARLLRDGNREARFVCSRSYARPVYLAISLVALCAAIGTLHSGFLDVACAFLVVATGTGFMFAAPILPVYTPLCARVVRCFKWLVLLSAIGFVYGPNTLKWSWLLFSCLGPLGWAEWTRFSIRRKLPVSQWPRHLYL